MSEKSNIYFSENNNFEVSKKNIYQIIKDVRDVLFPGYFNSLLGEATRANLFLKERIYDLLTTEISKINKNTKYKGLYSYLKQFEGDLFFKVFNYSVKHHCYRILAPQLDFYFLRDLAKFLVDNDRCNFISIDLVIAIFNNANDIGISKFRKELHSSH